MIKRNIVFSVVLGFFFFVSYEGLYCAGGNGHTVSISQCPYDTSSITVDTLYGSTDIADPLLIELIASPQMQRLKHVRQYGVSFYAIKADDFTRFDHSVGVFYLTRLFGGSRTEQVAALLHDLSHGVFSHTIGFIYHDDALKADAHQDDIHAWYLKQCGIERILERHGLTLDDIHHKQSVFTVLEQELPDICADRLEYNLQGGYREGLLTQKEIHQIRDDIVYDDGQWFFRHQDIAELFADCSLVMTEHLWGSPQHKVVEYWLALALRHALQSGIISYHDIHFSTDDTVWRMLKHTDDAVIQAYIDLIENHSGCYMLVDSDVSSFDRIYRGKFRGIDPLVATEQGLQRLTTINPDYHKRFYRVKALMAAGWPVTFCCKHYT